MPSNQGQNFAKLLAPIVEKLWNKRVIDFDSEDYVPNCVDCPDCGYDGEGLAEQLAEMKRKMAQFDSGEIDDVDCLVAIGEILSEGAK